MPRFYSPAITSRFGLCAALTLALANPSLAAGTRRTSIAVEVDNWASVWTGNFAGTALTLRSANPTVGPGGGAAFANFQTADDYLYIAAWSDDAIQQGLLAQVSIDGQTILPDSANAWEVFASGIDLDNAASAPTPATLATQIGLANTGGGASFGWRVPAFGGLNNFTFPPGNPWVTVAGINTLCRWMWYDTDQQPGGAGQTPPFRTGWDHEEFLIFRLRLDCYDPPSGMTAWFPLDEPNNPNYTFDFVNPNIGVKVNAPPTVPGIVDAALQFGLSGGLPRHVRAPHSASLDIAGNNGFTIDAWVHASAQANQYIVRKAVLAGAGGTGGYSLYLDNFLRPVIVLDYPNATANIVTSAAFLPFPAWSHVAVSVTPVAAGNATYQFVINGVAQAPILAPRPFPSTNSGDLFIGSFNAAAGQHFLSFIDEVELFNRTLTVQEMIDLFRASERGKCKTDCNLNGRADLYDISTDFSADINLNQIPDECDCCPRDPNGNGIVDFGDITFILANFGQLCP